MNSHTDFDREREVMVRDQLMYRRIKDTRVLKAFNSVAREEFVLPQDKRAAYEDVPLPIGFGQTISQPYIVAYMLEALQLAEKDVVLEIGTGSGYVAALLGELVSKTYTLEIVPELYLRASKLLSRLHYKNVVPLLRDGYEGLSEYAPFDAIILSAAPPQVPEILLNQLKVDGRLIAPIGAIRLMQQLRLYEKIAERRFKETDLMGVAFVEMVEGRNV